MTVCTVQFHKQALEDPEWNVNLPNIKKTSHKNTTIHINVQRKAYFYVQNIFGVMLALAMIGFTVFALGEDELADQVNTILTLLLTAVAFKFAVSDSMPKVGYNTLMDGFFLNMLFSLFFLCIACTVCSLARTAIEDRLPSDSGWNANRLTCVTSIAFFCVVNLQWVYAAWRITTSHPAQLASTRGYDLEENRNWYSSIFASPNFFPPVLFGTDDNSRLPNCRRKLWQR